MAKKKSVKPAKLKPGEQPPEELRELFEKHEKYLKAGRANYSKADQTLAELLKRCEVGASVVIPASGKKPPVELTLVDQFADRNQVWSGSSCKRFKIESRELKPQEIGEESA